MAVSSQEIMHTPNGKQYPATQKWDFICENYAFAGILKTQVARTDKGGLLQLAIQVNDPGFYIGGTVYLFLSNNTVITCTDKDIRENKNNQAIAYYIFSIPEMNRLKTSTITDIRFSIKGKESTFSSQIGYFTAKNKKKYFADYNKAIQNNFQTEAEIRSLYK
jgi:hypothetical protein